MLREVLVGHIIRPGVVSVICAVVEVAVLERRIHWSAIPESRCCLPSALDIS
jgi:hypothetical protein